eukprot:gb/GFBE01008754.1/.p1 GENE.gb/GFBE01008754.1/~~gb/GFBE01008754.1/.p1  ORF type:complete len:194 (+),score=39.47 gb/GFBE01008754.1/:1-582(+)
MVLSLSLVPDEVLVMIMEAHAAKSEARAVAPRCKQVVDDNFQIRRIRPPADQTFVVDFEVNCHMAKHLYCAAFPKPAALGGDMNGSVTFARWLPAYLRSRAQSDIQHSLQASDGCMLWKFISKVREERNSGPPESPAPPYDCMQAGHLTVSEGCGECNRQVIGRLSADETEMLLNVLDYRRNTQAQPMAVVAA